MRSPIWILAIVCVLAGCAGPSWQEVRQQDSAVAYRRYLADHPRSKHAAEAHERLAVLQLEREPTLEGLERFRAQFAGSKALPELLARVESVAFERARSEATPDAYARFLAAFPDGSLRARATGNQFYVAAGGFSGRPAELAAFLRAHPESDYAAEAQRALEGLEARKHLAFARIALEIEIAPELPEPGRLRNVFAERARAIYANAGRTLVEGAADAVLRIRHGERAVAAREDGDLLARPGVLAETEVALLAGPDRREVFVDRFGIRVQDGDRRGGGSVLLAPAAASYWDRFYVPVASWPTSAALRSSTAPGGRIEGIGAAIGRAIAVSPDGGFREIDLADPAAPRTIGRYARPAPAARYGSAKTIAGRVVLYGEDGVEVVARRGSGYRRVSAFDRGSVGAVYGIEADGAHVLLAGTRGLMRLPLDGGPPQPLIDRPLRGVARVGDTLYLLDDRWLYAGPLADPRAQSFFTVADVGRALEPRALRVGGSLATVVGGRAVASYALAATGGAQLLSRMRTSAIGAVSDAAIVGGSLFLLGERGLLVVEPRSGRLMDSIDVEGRVALGAAGGQLVAIGGDRLDVVDATPWMASSMPASMAR